MKRRHRVLAEPDHQVAAKLKDTPGQWYAIAGGDLSRRHTFSQVAYRIRNGQQAAFRSTAGRFETRVSTDANDVELLARYVPTVHVPAVVSA